MFRCPFSRDSGPGTFIWTALAAPGVILSSGISASLRRGWLTLEGGQHDRGHQEQDYDRDHRYVLIVDVLGRRGRTRARPARRGRSKRTRRTA